MFVIQTEVRLAVYCAIMLMEMQINSAAQLSVSSPALTQILAIKLT